MEFFSHVKTIQLREGYYGKKKFSAQIKGEMKVWLATPLYKKKEINKSSHVPSGHGQTWLSTDSFSLLSVIVEWLLVVFSSFEFKVFLLLDLLPLTTKRSQSAQFLNPKLVRGGRFMPFLRALVSK